MALINYITSFSSVLDGINGLYVPQTDLENDIASLAMRTVVSASIILIVLTVFALLFSQKVPASKLPLFTLIALTMVGSTLTLVGSTIYLNTKSASGGPVHWHADIEFWACGNELELRDPTGMLSNKIGTATLHEHDDHRIHLEGVSVEDKVDATLGKFMHVIDGGITDQALVVPLNDDGNGPVFEDEVDGDGQSDAYASQVSQYIQNDTELGKVAVLKDNQKCGSELADVQVFVYNYDPETKEFAQTKIQNPRDYTFTQDPNVPPGDCIIVEFSATKDKTDKLCKQYGIRDVERCEQFGVEPDQRDICQSKQVDQLSQAAASSGLHSMHGQQIQYSESDNQPELSEKEILDMHPCAVFFDDQGKLTNVDIAKYDDNGKLIKPKTDCTSYVKALKAYNANSTNRGEN